MAEDFKMPDMNMDMPDIDAKPASEEPTGGDFSKMSSTSLPGDKKKFSFSIVILIIAIISLIISVYYILLDLSIAPFFFIIPTVIFPILLFICSAALIIFMIMYHHLKGKGI